jgi:hypothetical protein
MIDIIEAIRQDIATPATGGMDAEQMGTELNDLVDRGSKLAFKIAMEVARLGPRGERLLPMSQSLEDLTTGFRQLTDRVNGQDQGGAQDQVRGRMLKKLETLAAMITEEGSGPWDDLAEEVQDFGPAAARVCSVLNEMTGGLNEQESRLVQLGMSHARLTGAEFDSNSIPRKDSSEAPVATLSFEGKEIAPKAKEPAAEPTRVDPFATADSLLLPPSDDAGDPDFTSNVLPGEENRVSFPGLGLEKPDRFRLDGASGADMPLSDDGEKVYDLEEFGATPTDDAEGEPEDKTYDLSAFGAVPVTAGAPQDADQVYELSDFDPVALPESPHVDGVDQGVTEEVYDLAAFGASPLEGDSSGQDEEVYDLSSFGATPLEVGTGPEPSGDSAEDEVYDLSDFGAKPMN